MKTTIFFLLVAIVYTQAIEFTDEQKAKIKAHHEECKEISKVDDEVIAKAKKGEFVDDDKFKEHAFCFNKKTGFQDEAGDFKIDIIKKKINTIINDEAKTDTIVTKCAVKKATPQESAFEAIKCFHEQVKDNNGTVV